MVSNASTTVGAVVGAWGKPTPHNDFGNAKFNAKCGRACFRLFCFRLLLSFFRGIWTLMLLLLLLGLLFFSLPSSVGLCCSRVECDIPRSFRAPYKLRLRHTYVGVAGDAKIVPRWGGVEEMSVWEKDNLFIFCVDHYVPWMGYCCLHASWETVYSF